MRPQRTAAVAAKAAITALSEDTCDSNGKIADDCANDDADFAPGGRQQALLTFKRKKGSAPTSEGKKKRRQEATDKSTDENALNKPVQAVENPSLFDRLPTELRMKILTQLDDDIYTIISCMMVSKTFLDSMSIHNDPEKDWERRCRKMGAMKRSPGCKTWKETYLQIARRRCARCFRTTTAKLGLLLVTGPTFIVVCELCQLRPGRYQVITSTSAVRQWPILDGYLGNLLHKWRKVDDEYWVRDHLRSSVLKLVRRLNRQQQQQQNAQSQPQSPAQ